MHLRSADAVLAGGHVNINRLQGEPRHEDEEGDHSEHAADGRVIRRVVLVSQTDWLAEPVELAEELSGFLVLFRHLSLIIKNYYNLIIPNIFPPLLNLIY